MSALRFLGFSYLAVVSVFALAIAAADQAQLRQAMDTATEMVSAKQRTIVEIMTRLIVLPPRSALHVLAAP